MRYESARLVLPQRGEAPGQAEGAHGSVVQVPAGNRLQPSARRLPQEPQEASTPLDAARNRDGVESDRRLDPCLPLAASKDASAVQEDLGGNVVLQGQQVPSRLGDVQRPRPLEPDR